MLQGFLHGFLGDLVKSHPFDGRFYFLVGVQDLFDVPGYGFAIAVGVRREHDARGLVRKFAQFADDFFFALRYLVVRDEARFDIDGCLVGLRQVADMSDGCAHDIAVCFAYRIVI